MSTPTRLDPVPIAFSPCPNDTFAFHGLLADQVDRRGVLLAAVFGGVAARPRGAVEGHQLSAGPGQRIVVVLVGVAHTAAIQHHRMIQQRAVAVAVGVPKVGVNAGAT